jgi:chromosomal replication initiation ATPase DnaA
VSAQQLVLDLGQRPALGREDYLLAPSNADAVAWLDRWPDWPAPALTIHGPAGCGKTHLAHVWQARSGSRLIAAADLGVADLRELAAQPVAVEDADRGVDEQALFHLYNLAAERKQHVLLTARSAPAHWALSLADLRSRLRAAPAVALVLPDEALIAAVLVKLLADRQLKVGSDVISFLVVRMERSFAAARNMVAALDGAALAARSNITVPLARQVLQTQSKKDEED